MIKPMPDSAPPIGGHRNEARIPEVMARLRTIWIKHPQLRLGQLLCICAQMNDIFSVEDSELVNRAESWDSYIDTQAQLEKESATK